MEMKPRMIDIPSGPQGGLVYNPDPYKTFSSPYRIREALQYAQTAGKEPHELTKEELERFRIPGR